METPNLGGGGGTITTDIHASGNAWIADQGDLPAVMIKSISTSEIVSSGTKMVIESEQNLTDIGANIAINPPEGAMTPPTMPTFPTGLPTGQDHDHHPHDHHHHAGNYFHDPDDHHLSRRGHYHVHGCRADADLPGRFPGGWNSSWAWTDPNDDATYSLAARSGYLRLTVPDGNDLAGATNYDAPRLLMTKAGDFAIETPGRVRPPARPTRAPACSSGRTKIPSYGSSSPLAVWGAELKTRRSASRSTAVSAS